VSVGEAPTPSGGARLSTGNVELDRMLDGGFVPYRPYLLVGPAGTGKTTLALQFLCDGVRRGERVLFVTVEEPPNEVLWNHRALEPELGRVEVFDAIPDVMRFERTPFRDIASVRASIPFAHVERVIRKTPELTSVEVTISALEQMLRTEVQRKGYQRVVIDSLTALQYFCMKGYEPGLGAQSFLRFLSDLRVTTLLTVEAPLEDVESPERMLARGEVRLFRWELDGVTVRAIGVEKFRGSSHDVRLHPYRIGARGIDINLAATISRDNQQVIDSVAPEATPTGEPLLQEPTPVELLEQEVRDLLLVGGDTAGIKLEVEAALEAARQGEVTEAANHLSLALAAGAVAPSREQMLHRTLPASGEAALARLMARAEATRVGVGPARLPEPPILSAQLLRVLNESFARAPWPSEGPTVPEVEEPAPAPAVAEPPTPAHGPLPPATTPAPEPAHLGRELPGPVGDLVPTLDPVVGHAPRDPLAPPPAGEAAPTAPPSAHATPRARPEPPPLPTPARLSEPPAPPPFARGPAAGRAPPPAPARVEAPALPHVAPAAPSAPTSVEAEAGPSAPASRKRKRTTAGRKKALEPAPPVEAPAPAASPVTGPAAQPPSPATGEVAPPAPGPAEEAGAAKPKRRVVRKKKAPSVLAATPGPAPEGASGPAPTESPAAPMGSAPPLESPPKEAP
jgi:KaiC/GvpD/RAD55 family RecA-like ATPase